MNKLRWTSLMLGAVMATAPAAMQASVRQTAGQDIKNAGSDTKSATKSAGKGIAKGTKTGFRKTKNGTKKAYHKTVNGTKKAGDKIEGKPSPK